MEDIGPMRCPRHPNKYLERKEHTKTYNCDGCKMDGHGQGYMCTKCDYVLHLQCMFPSNKVSPSFLQNDVFKFKKKPDPVQKPSYKRYCDACGMEVKGFAYHCDESLIDLHPCCASLGSHLEIDEIRLTLKKDSTSKECDLCSSNDAKKSDIIDYGWFYASKNNDYKCHVSCIMNLAITSSKKSNSSMSSDGTALAKLELLPTVKKRRIGRNGSKYLRILKAIVTYVISIVIGDPTTIVTKLAVESVVQLGELLY